MKYDYKTSGKGRLKFNEFIHSEYMEEKNIKFGYWVRDFSGDIYQIDAITEREIFLCDIFYGRISSVSDEKLELIEEGDYINGKEVITIVPADVCGDETLSYPRFYTEAGEIPYEQLETLVTKERFNSQKTLIKGGR